MARFLIPLLLVLFAQGLYAAEAPCTEPVYRAFDFWVGDWQVHAPNGDRAGSNRITREERGCLLVERWEAEGGGTGQSYNFYDPAISAWRQLWVSGGVVIDYSGGLTDAGAMQMEGTITYRRDGRQARFRGTWTPRDDGSVLQEFVEWDSEAKAWTPWFTGRYTRRTATEER